MKFAAVEQLNDEKFRRLTGVKRTIFDKMTEILADAHKVKHSKGGRDHTLCIEDMLLMTLEYLREYRTYFHIAQSYGLSESAAYKTVKWVEDTLIKHPDFALPGRKALLKSDVITPASKYFTLSCVADLVFQEVRLHNIWTFLSSKKVVSDIVF